MNIVPWHEMEDDLQIGVVVTDMEHRVVTANEAFVDATGYQLDDVFGRNCRFLQGEETDHDAVLAIRSALRSLKSIQCSIVNYRKDGTPFRNLLQISPLIDGEGNVVQFIGIHVYQSIKVPTQLEVFPWISEESLFNQKNMGVVTYDRTSPRILKESIDFEESFYWHDFEPPQPKISFIAETLLPTQTGKFRIRAYRDSSNGTEPIAVIHGDVRNKSSVALRVHDQCFTSEVLGSLKCDCREQLQWAKDYVQVHGGLVIYLQQEGRGMGLANKIKAYSLQEHGLDTVDANKILGFEDDTREYSAVPFILRELGIKSVELLTNNPRKIDLLTSLGVDIVDRIPIIMESNPHSDNYLKAKGSRMGHMMEMTEVKQDDD